PSSARFDLGPGGHVLAVAMDGVDLSAGLLLVAAVHDDRIRETGADGGPPFKVLTADDGSWKFATSPAADEGWTALTFDDTEWPAMAPHLTPQIGAGKEGAWAIRPGAEDGALCLGLPPPGEGNPPMDHGRHRQVL